MRNVGENFVEQMPENEFFYFLLLFQCISCSVLTLALNAGHIHMTIVPAPYIRRSNVLLISFFTKSDRVLRNFFFNKQREILQYQRIVCTVPPSPGLRTGFPGAHRWRKHRSALPLSKRAVLKPLRRLPASRSSRLWR